MTLTCHVYQCMSVSAKCLYVSVRYAEGIKKKHGKTETVRPYVTMRDMQAPDWKEGPHCFSFSMFFFFFFFCNAYNNEIRCWLRIFVYAKRLVCFRVCDP